MNNKEFITELSSRLNLQFKETQDVANNLLETFTSLLEKGNEVALTGFGSFEVKKRNERIIINPSSGKKMLVPPKLTVNFKQSSILKAKTQGTKEKTEINT